MLIFAISLILALLGLIIWDPLNYRQDPATPLARLIAWIRAHLIDDAKRFHHFWSVRFNAAGLAILSWVSLDPISTLNIWNMMPGDVRAFLPRQFVLLIGTILIGLALLSRVVKQKSPGNG